MRFVRWVASSYLNKLTLTSRSSDPEYLIALQYLESILAKLKPSGELSTYRCDIDDELKLVAIARSIDSPKQQPFNYIQITDIGLSNSGLRFRNSPQDSDFRIPRARALHYTVFLSTTQATIFLDCLLEEWRASGRTDLVQGFGVPDLKRMAKVDPYKQHVDATHWLRK